jgi:hypothetical protein
MTVQSFSMTTSSSLNIRLVLFNPSSLPLVLVIITELFKTDYLSVLAIVFQGELIEKRVTDLTLDEFRSYGPQDEGGSV